ncbi:GntR family transcriptional regulator [Granulosicoccus sp.]|nr:GntR family transcriptional regulator [Granulosicoccus sp.]MDB4222132.1 GntR family transcriptional regulator [Granulosicoccus sp.]
MTNKTSQQTNKELFYDDLKWKILTMKLEPGSDLDEVRFSEEHGLSRTPVRDIFRRMAGEGFVDIVGNRGASVASMNHKTMKEFVQTGPLIYTSVARLAVNNATPAQVRELKRIQTKYRNSSKKFVVNEMVIFNDQFHAKLGQMADNHYLSASLQRLLIDDARIAYTYFDRANIKETDLISKSTEHHEQLIEAIDRGHEEEAVRVTLEHWDLSLIQSDLFVNPAPIPLELQIC